MRPYALAVAGSLISACAGMACLVLLFGTRSIVEALRGANYSFIALAFALGVFSQVLKAERAAVMLRQHRPIAFWQSFGTMVVGNGLGDIIPFGGTGLALRPVLTHRVAGIPIALSSSVFAAITAFDVVGLLPFMGYLILVVRLDEWQRLLIVGALGPMLLFLLLPVLAGPVRRRLQRANRDASKTGWRSGVARLGDDVANGLATVTTIGRWQAAGLVGISLLITVVTLIRLDLVLNAVTLDPGPSRLVYLGVLGALVSSIPLRVPGSGAWTTAKMLWLSGIAGPGSGGYVLLSRLLGSIETPLLALGVVLWWIWSRGSSALPKRLSDLRADMGLE